MKNLFENIVVFFGEMIAFFLIVYLSSAFII